MAELATGMASGLWDLVLVKGRFFVENVLTYLGVCCLGCAKMMDYEIPPEDREQESVSTIKSGGESVRVGNVIGKTKEGMLIRVN